MVRPTGLEGIRFQWSAQQVFRFSMVCPTGPGGFVFKYWFAQRVWRGFGFFFNGLPNGSGGVSFFNGLPNGSGGVSFFNGLDSFLSTGSPNGSGGVSFFNGLPNGSGGVSFVNGLPNGPGGICF